MSFGVVRLLFLAFSLLAWPAALSSASSDYLSESEGSGLEVRSVPSGAEVSVNGVYQGKTPLVLENVVPGSTRLRLEKEGYWPRSTVVVVPSGKRLTVRLKLEEARGIIRVEPPLGIGIADPVVLIDGEPASVGDNEADEGMHSVRVRAFGFEDEVRSVFVERGERESVQIELSPARFRMDSLRIGRRRFNPANPGLLGTNTVSFTVSAPGAAGLAVYDHAGQRVFEARRDSLETWEQTFSWNGRSSAGVPLPDGSYTVVVAASASDGSEELRLETTADIDSSILIRPVSVSGTAGGPLFAPQARTIPAGSFQVEALSLFGKPLASEAFGAPPFSLGVRFSPLDKTEVSAALRIDPAEDGTVSFGASGKRELAADARDRAFSLSAALSWTYTSETEPSPFGVEPGMEASLPLDAALGEFGPVTVTLHAAPALLWSGKRGIPDDAAPEAILGAGVGIAGRDYTAALSAKFHFEDALMIGAEARFFPPPSMLVFTVVAGTWRRDQDSGIFGGAGLGILY